MKLLALLTTIVVLLSNPVEAQVIISDDQISITGIVTDIGINDFTVQTGTSEFSIDTSEIGIADTLDELLVEGLEVQVAGNLDERGYPNPTIEAEQIRILGQYRAPDAGVIILDGRG